MYCINTAALAQDSSYHLVVVSGHMNDDDPSFFVIIMHVSLKLVGGERYIVYVDSTNKPGDDRCDLLNPPACVVFWPFL